MDPNGCQIHSNNITTQTKGKISNDISVISWQAGKSVTAVPQYCRCTMMTEPEIEWTPTEGKTTEAALSYKHPGTGAQVPKVGDQLTT